MYKYFSIGRFHDFVKHATNTYPQIDSFELIGQPKIHGTHIDLVRTAEEPDKIQVQSRNNILSLDSDMYGVVSFIKARESIILDKIFESINNTKPCKEKIIIACEFAGGNIQSNVALNQVAKFLVIYGVKVDNEWMAQNEVVTATKWIPGWAALKLESTDDRIYTVADTSLHDIVLDMKNPEETRNKIAALVDQIDKHCPFASETFFVSGIGEGLVFHAKGYESDTEMYFKEKGASHSDTKIRPLKPVSEEALAKMKTVRGFVDGVLTSRRLEQGYEYLMEQQIDKNVIGNIGEYIRWIIGDIVKECTDDMETLGLNDALTKKAIMKDVSSRAQAYYKSNMSSE